MTEPTTDPFASHAIVELMGHMRVAGYTTETTIAGAGFVRVDIPDENGAVKGTKYCSPGSIYAITPCDEETARTVANPRWSPGRFPAIEPAETYHGDIDEDFDEDLDGQDEDDNA